MTSKKSSDEYVVFLKGGIGSRERLPQFVCKYSLRLFCKYIAITDWRSKKGFLGYWESE